MTTTVKKEPKKAEPIFFDEASYNLFKKREEDLKATVKELYQIAETALGVDMVNNAKEFLSNPKDYLINTYWLLYGDLRPKHLNPSIVFVNDTNTSLSRLNDLKKTLDSQIKALQQYQPIINKTGISYSVEQSKFNKYLDPKKAPHYRALEKFLESARELKNYENSNDIHLIRYSNSLIFQGLTAEINKHYFIK